MALKAVFAARLALRQVGDFLAFTMALSANLQVRQGAGSRAAHQLRGLWHQ